jgi:hypothetical protein
MKSVNLLSMNFTTGDREIIASANNGNVWGSILLWDRDFTSRYREKSEYSVKEKWVNIGWGENTFSAAGAQIRQKGITRRVSGVSYTQILNNSYRGVQTRSANFQDSRDVPEPAAGLGLLAVGLTTCGGAILRRRQARQVALSLD